MICTASWAASAAASSTPDMHNIYSDPLRARSSSYGWSRSFSHAPARFTYSHRSFR